MEFMDHRNLESVMKKLSVTAVLAMATVFSVYTGDLAPVYAATVQQPATVGSGAGSSSYNALQTYLHSTETLIAAAQASGPKTHGSANAAGAQVYKQYCAACHGENREGKPPTFPSLKGVGSRLSRQQITDRIHQGKGVMPPFPNLQGEQLTSLLHFLGSSATPAAKSASAVKAAPSAEEAPATKEAAAAEAAPASAMHLTSGPLTAGASLFQQNCAFCHGRDAAGGESGPDLTRSKLVAADRRGDKISEVVRNGRTEGDKKMPAFKFSDSEMDGIVAFVHDQTRKANAKPGGRRGVDVADLQTGNAAAGKQYFEAAGGCASCHSPTGDLAHIASRYQGLELEERMLYPRNVKSKVTVTTPSGEKIVGTEAYLDEFTVGLIDQDGRYRSWPVAAVKYSVENPVEAHVAQFPKYTDADIHNLMAYVQTLR
jgi:cytochrome c oxidase cbb3-type subunit 3